MPIRPEKPGDREAIRHVTRPKHGRRFRCRRGSHHQRSGRYPFLLFTAQLPTLARCCIAKSIFSLGHCGAQKSTRHLGPPPCWPLWIQLLHRLPGCAEIEQVLFALYTFQHHPLSKLLVNSVLPAGSRTAWALLNKVEMSGSSTDIGPTRGQWHP
jgi:hypothetical protein